MKSKKSNLLKEVGKTQMQPLKDKSRVYFSFHPLPNVDYKIHVDYIWKLFFFGTRKPFCRARLLHD